MGGQPPREREGNGRGTPGSGPVKTVFLLQDLKFGGTQRQAVELASRIDPSRFSIRLWLMTEGDDFLPRAEELKLPVRWLSRGKRVGVESLVNLWRSLRRERIDLLVLWTVVPNIWGRILGRLTGTRHIVGTCRGGASPARQHERFLSTLADHHICNSTALGNAYLGRYRVPKKRVSVIPNGIDAPPGPHRVHAAPSNPGVILSVARLVPDKDHDTLVRAFAIVAGRNPGVELRIVGDGPRRQAVENLVRRAGLSHRVRFLPGRLDLLPLYRESDIFVLSSHREGLPNVVLEAMAAGLPVVASAVGGIPEVVRHGRTGWLVPPEDPGAMADALEHLLADDCMRSAFGDAGRRLVEEEYSLSRMVRCHVELFEKITGGRSRT